MARTKQNKRKITGKNPAKPATPHVAKGVNLYNPHVQQVQSDEEFETLKQKAAEAYELVCEKAKRKLEKNISCNREKYDKALLRYKQLYESHLQKLEKSWIVFQAGQQELEDGELTEPQMAQENAPIVSSLEESDDESDVSVLTEDS